MGVDIVDTRIYMIAAYVLTAAVLVGFAISLWMRVRKLPKP
jgi:hypothetical protein